MSLLAAARLAAPSGASFSAQTSNPGNSFTAAASFGSLRIASGTYTGDGGDNRAIGVAFQPDVVIVKGNTFQNAVLRTSTMSGDAAKPMVGSTGLTSNLIQSLTGGGFTIGTDPRVNWSGVTYTWTALSADAAAVKLGTYVGNGTSQTIGGLGFSPEYVATFSAGGNGATQRFTGMTRSFRFDADTGTTSGITALGSSDFSVGSDSTANASGTTYHYLALNELAGVVETGTYSGNGADSRDISPVGLSPDYVLLRADDTSSGRRAVHHPTALGGDETLGFDASLNSSNLIQALQSDGFQIGTSSTVNATGVTYYYLAIRDATGACSAPGARTVTASADSYVDEAAPSANHGTSQDLYVTSKSANANRRTLVNFTLPALGPGCSATDADLQLYSTAAVTGRTIEAYRAAASWTETGVTWSNQPATTGAGAASPSGLGWLSWDVTAQVQAMYAGTSNGFVLRDQTEGSAASPEQKYDSRENPNDPRLIITAG